MSHKRLRLTRRSPLPSNGFADLHDGRDVRIVGDISDDLRAVATERRLECPQGRRVDVARRDELRRASRSATRKALTDLVTQAGIAEPFLDQWHVAGAVVVVI